MTINRAVEFWEKVRRGSKEECWPWLGYIVKGRGLTSHQYVSMYSSRKAWILTHGPIREDVCVLHRCDNGICCNPDHLYLGTRADNMIDRFGNTSSDKRSARGRHQVLDETELERLWQMRRDGKLLRECAAEFGVHISTICRYITARRKLDLEKFQRARSDRSSAFAK